jgi:hypothetical protein
MFETLAQRAIDIVYLFPSHIGVIRNLKSYVREPQSHLDKLWGTREWRELPMARMVAGLSPTADPGDAYYQSWAAAFCDRVATLGCVHHDMKGPLRNETNAPMYHLLFFSKSEAGLTIWRNVHRIAPDGQRSLRFE